MQISRPQRPRLTVFVIAAIVAILTTGCQRPPQVAPRAPQPQPRALAPVAGPEQPAVPESGVLTGGWFAPEGDWLKATEQRLWEQREADAGRTYDVAQTFYSFGKSFPTWREPWHIAQGRTPLVTWGAVSAADVAAGRHDATIRDRAAGLRDLDAPVFLRWFGEMDGNAKRALAGDPATFIAAWRHMHDEFRAAGADNVAFVWCPNAWAFDVSLQNAMQWYPGGQYVDWVCADGYNWAPTWEHADWTSFETVFANFYDWAAGTGKPIMIGEFGAMERNPGEKAAWIQGVRSTVKARFPAIKALVYYDEHRCEDDARCYDWSLDSTSASYSAWNTLARDPYFNPQP
ncbi:hypothetical protein BH24ACT3_BH24ACT3_14870 [soil metagenome]